MGSFVSFLEVYQPQWCVDFFAHFSSPEDQDGSGAYTASYSEVTRVLSRAKTSQGMKLNTHLHPVLRLRMSGAIPLLCLYAVMAWTGKTLPFTIGNPT